MIQHTKFTSMLKREGWEPTPTDPETFVNRDYEFAMTVPFQSGQVPDDTSYPELLQWHYDMFKATVADHENRRRHVTSAPIRYTPNQS